MTILYEWRDELKRCETPVLYTHGTSNFRSVYGYPEKTAEFIKTNGNTKNLKGKDVYSNELFIDVDDDKNVLKVTQKLVDLNLQFATYTTGNRGMHYHIRIVPMWGQNVPYSQIKWLKDNGFWELIDQTIYTEGSQFRTIGAVHEKTGMLKTFNEAYSGILLMIDRAVPPPIPDVQTSWEEDPDETDKQTYFMNLMAKRGVGARHKHMFILWRSGLKAGFDVETVKESIRNWNTHQDTPHAPDMIEKKLGSFKA